MKDKKNMAMIIIVGIVIVLFLCVNSTVFATTGTVIGSELRLRKEESTSSEILDLLDENDKVEILGENGDWYKVKANEKVGYVNKQYIKVKEENTLNNETTSQSEQSTASNESTENNTTTENAENSTPNENTIANNEVDKTEESNQEVEEQPKDVKFVSDVELKVMPLINGTAITTTSSEEKYEVISTAGLWSYVRSGAKSGWVLTEKTTIVNDEPVQENKPEENATEENKPTENVAEGNKQNENVAEENKAEETKQEKSSTEKLYSNAKTYYVKGTSVNARSAASKTADVVKVLNTNNSVKVIGEDESWYAVEINGSKAYISKSLLSKEKVEVTSRSSNSLSQNNEASATVSTGVSQPADTGSQTVASNPSGNAIVAYAKTFLGYRYVYGTNGPNTFDCSGFVQYVYKHFGYSLSRSSGTQANDGVAVSKSNLQPGDVLIFRDTSNTRIGHVGIYIGDGQFIHASNSRTGVITSSLSTSAYQKRYVGARRIL